MDIFKVNPTNKTIDLMDTEEDSLLNLFDESNPDVAYFNNVDAESIRLSGSKVEFFKYMIQEDSIDDVYLEERNKVISSEPVTIWGHYDPTPIDQGLGEFGLQIENDKTFIFNKAYIEGAIGRAPIEGDVIRPVFQNQKYQIIQVVESEYHVYGVYHYACEAKILRDDQETHKQDTQRSPDVGGVIQLEE